MPKISLLHLSSLCLQNESDRSVNMKIGNKKKSTVFFCFCCGFISSNSCKTFQVPPTTVRNSQMVNVSHMQREDMLLS